MNYSSGKFKNTISFLLVLSLLATLCVNVFPATASSETGFHTINEQLIHETLISENCIDEFITEEIYLEEITVAETKIEELLLEDVQVDDVILCRTIYIPQANIKEFSDNSQLAQLFGPQVDLALLLTKLAVGTGVILTLAILTKVDLAKPVASVVAAAADSSMKFAESGAAIGSLFGGLTGTADEIDETGRTSSVIAFATATAGLLLTTISFISALPSAGSTTITAAAGIKLVIAGIGMFSAAAGTSYAGYKAVKTFTVTESKDIDWKHINWKKVGVSAAQKSIQNAADGYMWGSIVGAVYGGAEGLDYYQKYNTPYTKYNERLAQTPKDGRGGYWSGKRGESDYILDNPIELSDGTKITQVTYKNAIPDFSPYQEAQVKIPNMTNNRVSNFEQADAKLADYWKTIKYKGQDWNPRDVRNYRKNNGLTWHEMSNMDSMQLVPAEVNQQFTHFGGVAEYNAMRGATEFD